MTFGVPSDLFGDEAAHLFIVSLKCADKRDVPYYYSAAVNSGYVDNSKHAMEGDENALHENKQWELV